MARISPRVSGTGSRLAANAVLVMASIAVCFLCLEIGVRILNGVPAFTTDNFVAIELDQMHNEKNIGADYDPRVGWIQKPNVLSPNYTTGQYGVRMPSPKIVPLQQGAILMVGDSFGAGSDVSDAESWPAQLERALGTQVINAGVGGYGFDQIVLRAETLLPLLKPRVLLAEVRLGYANIVNRMSVASGAPKPYFTIRNGELVRHNEPVPRLASTSRDLGWTRYILGHSYLVQYVMARLNLLQWWINDARIKWETSESDGVQVTCLLMRRLALLRDKSDVKVALVLQYSAQDGMQSPISDAKNRDMAVACAKNEGLDVIDGLNVLQEAFKAGGLDAYKKLWVMYGANTYGHMSAEGNRLIARLVEGHLANMMTEVKER